MTFQSDTSPSGGGGVASSVVEINTDFMEVRRRLKACHDPIALESEIGLLKVEKNLPVRVIRECLKEIRKETQERAKEQQRGLDSPTTDSDPETAIRKINAGHAVVQYGSRVMILCENYEPVLNRHSLALLSRHDFVLKWANKSVLLPRGDKVASVSWGEYWLSHPTRRQYEGIVFDPRREIPGYYNLWRGLSIQPKSGNCTLLRRHLLEVICCGNNAKFDYLWKWCAHAVQRTGEMPETAIVMRSAHGAGKNTWVDALGKIFGRHYIPLTQPGMLCGRFNAHLADAVLVFANESVWGGDKAGEGRLKAMITDGIETIEAKGKDPITIPNFKRLIVSSNETWAVPRGIGDRRFFCLDVSDSKVGDKAYFAKLHKEINDGGLEAFLDELLKTDIDGWHPRCAMPAENKDGEDIKVLSLSSPLKFWLHCLTKGSNTEFMPGIDSAWNTEVTHSDLYDQYIAYCDVQHIANRFHYKLFSRELKKAVSYEVKRPKGDEGRYRSYLFPCLEEARRQFQEKIAYVDLDE